MVLNHSVNSRFCWGSVLFCSRVLVRMSLVSLIGICVYRFVMSRDANLKWGKNGVCFSLFIRSLVLLML